MKTLLYLLIPLIGFTQSPDSLVESMLKTKQADESLFLPPRDTLEEKSHSLLEQKQSANENLENENKKEHHWSFGVLYIPYYSGNIFHFYRDLYHPEDFTLVSYSDNLTMMEGQFSFRLHSQLRLIFDIGYLTTTQNEKWERHLRDNDPNNPGYDVGTAATSEMKIFDLNVGVKYYLTDLIVQNVSAYFMVGGGKQFAFVNEKYEVLFLTPPPIYTLENNLDEFLEDINSPYQIYFGFGAEYFFNESLALVSNLRFSYSKSNALYDYRQNTPSVIETGSHEYKYSATVTLIGIGINFYFY